VRNEAAKGGARHGSWKGDESALDSYAETRTATLPEHCAWPHQCHTFAGLQAEPTLHARFLALCLPPEDTTITHHPNTSQPIALCSWACRRSMG